MGILLSAGMLFLLFLIPMLLLRWFWCWYFKLNKITKCLEDMQWNLQQINKDQLEGARMIIRTLNSHSIEPDTNHNSADTTEVTPLDDDSVTSEQLWKRNKKL